MELSEVAEDLRPFIERVMAGKEKVLIAVVGKNGVGKSYFGKYVRKHGIGRYKGKSIAVIDDRVMTIRRFCFFRRKIRIPDNGVDELQPWINALPEGTRIILYVNNSPHKKISKADILLKLTINENMRKKRLVDRYGIGSDRFNRFFYHSQDRDYRIVYDHYVEARL